MDHGIIRFRRLTVGKKKSVEDLDDFYVVSHVKITFRINWVKQNILLIILLLLHIKRSLYVTI